jgi:hypothetical protein
MKKSMLAKLIDKWESEKEVIFQTDLSMIFISEAKAFLERKEKSMLPDLIKCKSDVSSGRILKI